MAAAANPWMALGIGASAGALVAVFLLGVCAVMVTAAVISERWIDVCVLLACAVGTLIGGRIALRGGRKATLLSGLGSGLLAAALLGVSGLLLYGELEMGRCIAVSCACLGGGGVAGLLGRSGGKKHRA